MKALRVIVLMVVLMTAGSYAQEPEPLTLTEAVQRALDQSHQLRASQYSAEAAGFRVDQAGTAYLPRLNATSNYLHSESNQGSTGFAGDGQVFFNPDVAAARDSRSIRDNVSIQVGGSYSIFDPVRGHSVKQARENENAALAELESTEQELVLQVTTAFYQAWLNTELLEIRRQEVANREQALTQATGFYEAGTSALSEVKRAEAALAQAQLEMTRAETNLELDWVELNRRMGLPSSQSYQLQADMEPEIPQAYSLEDYMTVALDNRPELVAGWARVRAQLARVDAAVADRWPTLSARANYNLNGQPTPFDRTWSAGLVLSWEFFDGGLGKATAAEAKATAESLAEQVREQSNEVYQQVATALVGARQAVVQRQTALIGVEAAEESRRLAFERYRVGVGNALELSDAELALTLVRAELARAYNAERLSEAQLARAVGVKDLDEIRPKETSE